MAETTKFELTIKVEGDGSSTAADASTAGGSGNNNSAQTKSLSSFVAAQIGLPVVRGIVSYKISHVSMTTGSQHLQDQWNFALQIGGDIAGVAAGAAAGAFFGPVGIAIGATAGVVKAAIGYAQRAAEYDYNRSWDEVSTNLQIQRAGPSFNQSRLG